MPQGNFIFGTLFVAFVIFITARGELPKYMGFILAPSKPGSPVTRGPDLEPPGSVVSDAAKFVKDNPEIALAIL